MDSDEIQRLIDQLKLTEEADANPVTLNPILTENLREGAKFCLVGKIFAGKQVNRDNLISQLPRILQSRQKVDVEVVGDNLFVAHFVSLCDKQQALFGGPWHFFQDLLLFAELEGFQNPSDIRFEDFTGWIQCHNLPVACMHPDVIRRIGEEIGRVEEIDMGTGGLCLGRFARVRVRWSISKPLKRCVRLVPDGDMEGAIIILLYEKLPNLCYGCGRMGHILRFCEDRTIDRIRPQFGAWLNAPKITEPRHKQTSLSHSRPSHGRRETDAGLSSQAESDPEKKDDISAAKGFGSINSTSRAGDGLEREMGESREVIVAKVVAISEREGMVLVREREGVIPPAVCGQEDREVFKPLLEEGGEVLAGGKKALKWKNSARKGKGVWGGRSGRGGRGDKGGRELSTLNPIIGKKRGDLNSSFSEDGSAIKKARGLINEEIDFSHFSTAAAVSQPRRDQ